MLRALVLLLPVALGDEVDFAREVEPLLAARCSRCHGVEKQRGGLRLDDRGRALQGGDSGEAAIAPGEPERSHLLARVRPEHPDDVMPPTGEPLADDEVALLRRWIEEGASYGERGAGAARSNHWAYRTPERPPLPRPERGSWVRDPIDCFVLARLEAEGLAPAPESDAATLVRRLHLDLLGLPPSPARVAAFLADARPDAYERLVDELFASPHHAEREARLWMDLARYADSHGYTFDDERPMWRWRDELIRAFERDQPFDEFTVEQLAGDLLPGATLEQRIASAFHRNTMVNQEGGADDEEFRVAAVIDRVNTTATVWLGTTLECAQCHSHKYDPFTQRDYYRLFAFFNDTADGGTRAGPSIAAPTPELRAELERIDVELAELQAELAGEAAGSAALEARIAELEAARPEVPRVLVMQELAEPRETHLLLRGSFLAHGPAVEPGVPEVLPPLSEPGRRPDRLDLARWLVAPENPLTARVVVNREWQRFFGLGLVETEDDFGTRGAPPSHPELLDWLAVELVESGWDRRRIQRLIVTSATYRQSSRLTPELRERDPRNRLLARQSRPRLEAEAIRDSALLASGLLSPARFGPPVHPPQPAGVFAFTQKQKPWPEAEGADRYRRTLYTKLWRSSLHPFLATFDVPPGDRACTRRGRSNTPLQALALANDPMFVELAQGLAARVLREEHPDERARLVRAFRLCLARAPSERELALLERFLAGQQASFGREPGAAREVAPRLDGIEPVRGAAWTATARVLFNLDEFVTRE